MPISLAHKLAKRLTQVRKDGTPAYLRPDGKTQVTVEYEDDRSRSGWTRWSSPLSTTTEVSLEQIRAGYSASR